MMVLGKMQQLWALSCRQLNTCYEESVQAFSVSYALGHTPNGTGSRKIQTHAGKGHLDWAGTHTFVLFSNWQHVL